MVTKINKESYPYIFPTLAAAALTIYFNIPFVTYALLFLIGFFAFFFRDPERIIPKQEGILVAPSDGVIKSITKLGKYKEIYTFIKPLDVHINRAPSNGIVEAVMRKSGKHKMAFKKSATLNEENYITIISGKNKLIVVQVVGFMARRIKCWVKAFDKVEIGQPIGMLLFGSGTRIIMPASAKILVKEKQKIRAGETIIAKL